MGGGAGHDVEVVGHPVVLQGEAEPGPGHHAQHHRRPHGHQATGLVMLCRVVSCPVRIYYRDHGKHVKVMFEDILYVVQYSEQAPSASTIS